MPIDKSAKRSTQIHTCIYNLALHEDVQQLLDFITMNKDRIAWIHFAPACGTASKAREKKLTHLEDEGYDVAKPLRSEEFPSGFPTLQGLDKTRVDQANLVYQHTATIIRHAASLHIQCSIETPSNSLFWIVPAIAKLMRDFPGYNVVFDNCCHGGLRKKASRWWSLHGWFNSLAVLCDGNHYHASWKPVKHQGRLIYPTAEEAAYPVLLCERLSQILLDKVIEFGAVKAETLTQQVAVKPMHRFLLDMLPRGKRFKPLVSCFQHYVLTIHAPTEDPFEVCRLPSGSAVQARRMLTGDELRAEYNDFKDLAKFREYIFSKNVTSEQVIGTNSFGATTFGVPREPLDFLRRAVETGHPRSLAIHLSQDVTRVLEANLTGDLYRIALKRVRYLQKWSSRARELESSEAKLKKDMAPHLAKLLASKRLQLFGEMLADCNYPDTELVNDIKNGFSLSGWLQPSGVFPKQTKRPQFSVDTLRKLAQGLNQSIMSQLSAGDWSDDVVKKTWELTQEEVASGYIWEDTSGNNAVCLAKRFGLVQKNKVRLIDDCTIGGLNKTVGVVEKFRIHCLDEIVAYLSWFMGQARNHDYNSELVGRTNDLTAAYKQFGVCEHDRDLLRLAVVNTDDNKISLMGLNSLPFGAVGSVCGFLRISLAVWFLGITQLDLAWTAFFDDYTVFTQKLLDTNTSKTIESLFELIGLDFAREGSKAPAFSQKFRSLGVELNLGLCHKGIVAISHTEERVQELSSLLADFLESGVITSKQAESLRGRMHWFESFAFGRVAHQAIAQLGELSRRERKKIYLSENDKQLISFLKDRVLTAPPLLVTPSSLETWIIFTDGACEGLERRVGSIGGVLVSPTGVLVSYFGAEVPEWIMDQMAYSQNPIYELELLPALVAILVWQSALKSRQVVFYLDNDAARYTLIKAHSVTSFGKRIVAPFVSLELSLQLKAWYARVPSASNIADDPSRRRFDLLESMGASRSELIWSEIGKQLLCVAK